MRSRKSLIAGMAASFGTLALPLMAMTTPAPINGNEAKSLMQLKALMDAGITPVIKYATVNHTSLPSTGVVVGSPAKGAPSGFTAGNPSNDVPPCFAQRTTLPCGTYTDKATFEADHGPFSRALGNLEDWELTNGPPNNFCDVDSPDVQDCGKSPSGICGTAIDAGDLLTGIGFQENPVEPTGFFGTLVAGPGFEGGSTGKWCTANYFGTAGRLTFPQSPAACGATTGLPLAVSFSALNPVGSPGDTIKVVLADGTKFNYDIPGSSPSDPQFSGVCCTQGIDHIDIVENGGTAAGYDNVEFTATAGTCNPDLSPVTTEDLYQNQTCLADAIAALELKLDNGTGGGSGGSSAKAVLPNASFGSSRTR